MLKHLIAPFPLTRWNVSTFAVAWGAVVTGSHFLLTPVLGVPEPAGFFIALAIVMPAWTALVRRDEGMRI